MAKPLARISGVAIRPGVSRNARLYTRENIAKLVERASSRIGGGDSPITMRTHHGAGDDSTRIVGRVTRIWQDESGAARYEGEIADAGHGPTIAGLLPTSENDTVGGAARGVDPRPVGLPAPAHHRRGRQRGGDRRRSGDRRPGLHRQPRRGRRARGGGVRPGGAEGAAGAAELREVLGALGGARHRRGRPGRRDHRDLDRDRPGARRLRAVRRPRGLPAGPGPAVPAGHPGERRAGVAGAAPGRHRPAVHRRAAQAGPRPSNESADRVRRLRRPGGRVAGPVPVPGGRRGLPGRRRQPGVRRRLPDQPDQRPDHGLRVLLPAGPARPGRRRPGGDGRGPGRDQGDRPGPGRRHRHPPRRRDRARGRRERPRPGHRRADGAASPGGSCCTP